MATSQPKKPSNGMSTPLEARQWRPLGRLELRQERPLGLITVAGPAGVGECDARRGGPADVAWTGELKHEAAVICCRRPETGSISRGIEGGFPALVMACRSVLVAYEFAILGACGPWMGVRIKFAMTEIKKWARPTTHWPGYLGLEVVAQPLSCRPCIPATLGGCGLSSTS